MNYCSQKSGCVKPHVFRFQELISELIWKVSGYPPDYQKWVLYSDVKLTLIAYAPGREERERTKMLHTNSQNRIRKKTRLPAISPREYNIAGILGNDFIRGQQMHFLYSRLDDQHTVERIAV